MWSKKQKMQYFGTNLNEYGHFTWDLTGDYMELKGLLPATPFSPEELTRGLNKGQTAYYQGGGYTALAIAGSCTDGRPGTKSVFWVKENVSKARMMELISQNKHAAAIVAAMKFKIDWN